MRAELRSLQKQTGVTFIYITHDQSEALTMSDRIAVMNGGKIEQVGTGDDIYSNPASAFVASFVGEVNTLPGRIIRQEGALAQVETSLGPIIARNPQNMPLGGSCVVFVRPESVHLQPQMPTNRFQVVLERRDLEGAFVTLRLLAGQGRQPIIAHLPNTGPTHASTSLTSAGFDPQAALVLPHGTLAHTGREDTPR